MPHAPSNEYLDDIYKLRDVFLEKMKDDDEFVFYCKRNHLDKNDWVDLYALTLNKIKSCIDINSCLWSDFDWVFTELVERYLNYLKDHLSNKFRFALSDIYRIHRCDVLFEVYYGDVRSFLQINLDKKFTDI